MKILWQNTNTDNRQKNHLWYIFFTAISVPREGTVHEWSLKLNKSWFRSITFDESFLFVKICGWFQFSDCVRFHKTCMKLFQLIVISNQYQLIFDFQSRIMQGWDKIKSAGWHRTSSWFRKSDKIVILKKFSFQVIVFHLKF